MNREKYLPIGSVVLLKNAKKRVMITGFAAKGKETGDKMFDYIGCLFPEGVISSDQNLLFNHEQIDKIFYLGYSDDEEKELKVKLNKLVGDTPNVTEEPVNIEANDTSVEDNQVKEETKDLFGSLPNQPFMSNLQDNPNE